MFRYVPTVPTETCKISFRFSTSTLILPRTPTFSFLSEFQYLSTAAPFSPLTRQRGNATRKHCRSPACGSLHWDQHSTLCHPLPHLEPRRALTSGHERFSSAQEKERIPKDSIMLQTCHKRCSYLRLGGYGMHYIDSPPVTMPYKFGGLCRRKRRQLSLTKLS